MLGAIPLVVILNDVLDAHESLLVGLDFLQQCVEVPVYLAATALDLLIIVAVPWYQIDDDLGGDEILPECASYRGTSGEHHLCSVEVLPSLLEQVFDLPEISQCPLACDTVVRTEWFFRASTVSEADAAISAMGGYPPPGPRGSLAPSLPLQPLVPLLCAPFV